MRKFAIIFFWIFVVLLIVIRLFRIELDPPYFFRGYSTAPLTDPYHLTFFARNEVLFGNWNPFDFHRWDIFKYSLVSGLSYLVFLVGGVSRLTANITAVVLNLGGLLFFWVGFRRNRPPSESAPVLLLILISAMLFFYGRLPFLENGVIFLAGLLFFIFIKFHDTSRGQIASGVLIAAVVIHGKLFAVALLAPVLIVLLVQYRKKFIKPVLLVIGGFIIYAAFFFVVFLRGSFGVIEQYYMEQTVGMYGAPEGLISFFGFIEQFITYGSDSGFVRFSPFLIVSGGIGSIIYLLTNDLREKVSGDRLPYLFCFLWLIFGTLALIPFNYRPMRYGIYLYLPLAVMTVYLLALFLKGKMEFVGRIRPEAIILVFVIFWYLSSQVYLLTVPHHGEIASGISAMPFSFLSAVILTVAVFVLIRKAPKVLSLKGIGILFLIFMLGFGINQGRRIYSGLTRPGYDLKRISREIGEIISPDAVLTGPYAPTLLTENRLHGVIYHFGLAYVETDLFDKIPISHIVADRPNWEMAVEDFPVLSGAIRLAEMPLRDFAIGLFRINRAGARLTDFERGVMALRNNQPDTAVVWLEKAAKPYPENIIVQTRLGEAYLAAGQIENCRSLTERVAEKFPDNLRVLVYCGKIYMGLFGKTHYQEFLLEAEDYSSRALELIPE